MAATIIGFILAVIAAGKSVQRKFSDETMHWYLACDAVLIVVDWLTDSVPVSA